VVVVVVVVVVFSVSLAEKGWEQDKRGDVRGEEQIRDLAVVRNTGGNKFHVTIES